MYPLSASLDVLYSCDTEGFGSCIGGFNNTTLIGPYLCSQPVRCGQGTVLQCDKVCGALLNCAEHTCAQVCHSGSCQPCQRQVQQGESHCASTAPHNVLTDINVSFDLDSLVSESADVNICLFLFFQCATVALTLVQFCVAQIKKDLMVRGISPVKKYVGCKSLLPINHKALISVRQFPPLPDTHFPPFRMLDCEAHRCQQVCHRGRCQPCPRSPILVKSCPCGQTPLTKLLELGYAERQSCSDPIPSCGKTCNKPLACGSSGKEEGQSVSELEKVQVGGLQKMATTLPALFLDSEDTGQGKQSKPHMRANS